MKARTAGPALLALGLLLSCAGTAPDAPAASRDGATAVQRGSGPLPVPTDLDYQLGGGNDELPEAVGIVARDRNDSPLAGHYNVCYVNGFQTQPDEKAFWRKHWRLVLKRGRPVKDEVWGEWLLDLRTRDKRHDLARIVGRWTAGCADDGFQAVEFDNLDSFTRSHGLLTRRQALRYARLLVKGADEAELPAGQKNLAGYDGTAIGYTFAVAEECGRYDECDRYASSYGDQVLAIEYRDADFEITCEQYGDVWAVVRRDRALSPDFDPRWCPD